MAKEIQITIDTDGSVSVEALGYEGTDCEQATEFVEKALGTVQERRRKPEYYARRKDARRLSQR